ncbi:pyrroline-5-carboxylate reductase [Oxalobacteraceae bacterium GrIS 2.11]
MHNKITKPGQIGSKISFIGGGNMAGALIGGLCDELDIVTSNTICHHSDIHIVDVNPDSLKRLSGKFGVSTSTDIDESLRAADVIVLAVKPQQMREVAEKLAPHINNQLIISIAAGIRFSDLSRWLNNYQVIVRTMPNMPALIHQGITGIYAGPNVDAEQRAIANAIMSAVGTTVWLDDEALLDPLTAISGSGPAYVFYFIEAMQQAAQDMGFTEEQGRQLAMATFKGAATMACNSTEPVATLRERVTSKGGTTHAAISSMEQSGVAREIIVALKAAARRSQELGDEFGS